MTCQRIYVPPTTLWQAKEDAGMKHGGFLLGRYRMKHVGDRLVPMTDDEVAAEEERREREMTCEGGWTMQCGNGPPVPQCVCGRMADLLCDYPMGRGKTCDMALCSEHAHEIGDDRHLCVIHLAEFRGKARVERINPWPPKREGR